MEVSRECSSETLNGMVVAMSVAFVPIEGLEIKALLVGLVTKEKGFAGRSKFPPNHE